MVRFEYSALSPSGDLVRGELDGTSAAAVIERLHEQALLPIHAAELRSRTAGRFSLRLRAAQRLPVRELALFSQQLARLLKAGLPLDRALEILASLAGSRLAGQVVQRTLDGVRDGASLAEAMARQERAFPQAYVSMVRAGEAGGALQGVLARVAEFLTRSEAMRQRVVSSLIYPALLTVVAAVSVGIVLVVVLPEFEPVFREAGATLPASTRLMMAAGDGLGTYWWALLLGLILALLAWQHLMAQPAVAARRDRMVLASPVVGSLVTRFEVSRFSRTLGTLLANGVAAPRALALCARTVGNQALAEAVDVVATRFKEGEALSEALARTGHFPPLATQLVRIGEETGRLEEMLQEIAEIYDGEVQRTLERLLALLVPGITVTMGALIALIIASVMAALISINNLAI